ncbi:unnamed protein product [Didymodactylos carnosus]|uniref:G-protein coupled receptors family 1 profile domain-containing protein n=1 Tax=Didymodactylos carnosus TaxID=1234261 RepID=A0A815WBL7_9BILA|nr:unnamed protein product [Didymodactylos carnosus]CAF1541780.1 unnamed protein product [Didymodactylos carnosus]CAF3613432.1 unnamed protein product [Didymodactylos carnosus]CAF4402186.1 unnamed protein product [Didymodactylos carnosus]
MGAAIQTVLITIRGRGVNARHALSVQGGTLNAILLAASTWFSSILALERTLIELFFFKLFGLTRKHALIIVLLILIFCVCGRIPTMLTKVIARDPDDYHHHSFICTWKADTNLYSKLELIYQWINTGGTCFLHFLANILTLISIARRKVYLSRNHTYEITYWRAWCIQLSKHRDYFIPPTVILLSQLGPILFFQIGERQECLEPKPGLWAHLHLSVSFLQWIPHTVIFLIFIYPSEIYMKEFYSNTYAGKWLLTIKEKKYTCCY